MYPWRPRKYGDSMRYWRACTLWWGSVPCIVESFKNINLFHVFIVFFFSKKGFPRSIYNGKFGDALMCSNSRVITIISCLTYKIFLVYILFWYIIYLINLKESFLINRIRYINSNLTREVDIVRLNVIKNSDRHMIVCESF